MAVSETSGLREGGNHPQPIALWVIPVSALGGVARHVLDTAKAGLPGFDLVVLTPPGRLAEELRARGVRVAVGNFGPGAGMQASIRTLRSAAIRLRPAVVHSHLSYADIIVAMTPLPRHTIRVTTEHGIAGDDRVYHGTAVRSKIMAAVHTARLRRFDAVLAVAEATKRAMVEKWAPAQNIRVVLNGVDPVAVTEGSRGSDSLHILALARLSPEKRIPQLLRAFKLVLQVRKDARLTIAGIGDLEDELKNLARDLEIEASVSFPGFVDADEAMAEADVLAQLSVWENCSYSLLDAANRNMRVVASAVGGNPEIIEPRGLVDADDIEGVARALLDAQAITRLDHWPTVAEMTSAIADTYAHGRAESQNRAPQRSITLATNNGEVGGGEVMLLSIARMLSDIGTRVTIVGPSEPSGFIQAASAQGYEVVELPAAGRRAWMLALRRWDAKHRQDLLWCNGLVPAAATMGHRNRLVHLHLLPSGVIQRTLVALSRLGTKMTFVPSDWMRKQVRGAQTLTNWTQDFDQLPAREDAGTVTLGFLGRPSTAKGVDVLAQALAKLEATHPSEFRLRIGGEPFFVSDAERALVEEALKPVESIVDRAGWVERIDFFRTIDLLVVPSVWPETFGLVVAEAMALGVPVIVSDAGALPEVVGLASEVFRAGDPDDLYEAVLRKRANDLRSRVEVNRGRWAMHFSPGAARKRLSSLLSITPNAKEVKPN